MHVGDPLVRNLRSAGNACCGCVTTTGCCIGALVVSIIVTPFAMTISLFALPILGIKYWMNSRDHQFLWNKTIEIYDGKERQATGPTSEKNYMCNIPKENKQTREWEANGSPFKTVQDLSWLWHEYNRLVADERKKETLESIESWCIALIPIIGIWFAFARKAGVSRPCEECLSGGHEHRHLTPKEAVEAHFDNLRKKLRQKANDNGSSNFYKFSILKLNENPNMLEGIPKDFSI